jgi:hypothetical protein
MTVERLWSPRRVYANHRNLEEICQTFFGRAQSIGLRVHLSPPVMLSAFQKNVTQPVFRILFYVYLLLFRFSAWFRQTVIFRSSPAHRRTLSQTASIVIIGDCLAEGIGDNISQGGLSNRVNGLLREHRDQTKLKFSWQVLSAGRLYSTSTDWLPVADTAIAEANQSKASLFRRTFVTGPFRKAEVVVIVLGSQEDPASAAATVSNITRIAEALGRMGKHVLVASIPGYHEAKTDGAKACYARNTALAHALNGLPPDACATSGGSVSLDVDVSKVVSRGGDVVYEEADFLTLNAMGYRALAREVHDSVAVIAKRVEWAYWKSRLGARPHKECVSRMHAL